MPDITPYLAGAAAGLAIAVLTIGADRASVVRLTAADWRCAAVHDEKHAVPRAEGVAFETSSVCDRWERR